MCSNVNQLVNLLNLGHKISPQEIANFQLEVDARAGIAELVRPSPSSRRAITNHHIDTSNLLQYSIPEGKLFYPEPFIASPSYIYTDLTFLHIFQYWYWLWFMFTFLIAFFFISFLTVLR